MKARQFIANANFDPEQLKALGKAFDEAWEQIASQISSEPMPLRPAA